MPPRTAPRLHTLPADALGVIAGCVHADDKFAFARTCRALRSALGGAHTLTPRNATSAAHLRWKLAEGLPHTAETCSDAAAFGLLDPIRAAHAARVPSDLFHMYVAAAENGHVRVIQWLTFNRRINRDDARYVSQAAAENGHVDVLQWCHNVGWALGGAEGAARNGHVHVLDWLFRRGRLAREGELCYAAAEGGQLDVLRWLRARGFPWDKTTYKAALPYYCYYSVVVAETGNLDVLRFLHASGCPWDASICGDGHDAGMAAAQQGQVDMLEWLHARGVPLCDSEMLAMAARRGHLAAVKWLHTHGCPWDEYVYASALPVYTENGMGGAGYRAHPDVLEYLRANDCPWGGFHDSKFCNAAAQQGDLATLQFLHTCNCPWDEITCNWAASFGHLEVVKYLHENGCPWDAGSCDGAARFGYLAVVKYLHENGCPWDAETCTAALHGGHLDVLQYLRARTTTASVGVGS